MKGSNIYNDAKYFALSRALHNVHHVDQTYSEICDEQDWSV